MISREELHKLVWSKPMTKVAAEFDVSGSYMARVCAIMGVPRPERGYWAKLEYGKAPPPRPLPEPRPGDQLFWSKEGEYSVARTVTPAVPPRPRTPRPAKRVTGTHPLVAGAKTHFENSRRIDEGDYLKPYKKLLVDVTASATGLDMALAFANDLFNALESAGHHVMMAPHGEQFSRGHIDEHEQPKKRQNAYHDYSRLWAPCRPTVVYVGTVAIGLVVVEMSEPVLLRYVKGKYIRDADYVPPKTSSRYVEHTWTTTSDLPSGRLRLIAYSPYWRVNWSTSWQEGKSASLTRELPAIVRAIEDAAVEMVERLKEADRQAEIARMKQLAEEKRRRQEEDRRRIQQSIKESQVQLGQIIQAWSDVMNVERFLQGVEDRAAAVSTDERDAVLSRLKLAREFVGTKNPLDFFLSWKTPVERCQPGTLLTADDNEEDDLGGYGDDSYGNENYEESEDDV